MPARSKITMLPPEMKAEFDKLLIKQSFSHYEEITDWLNEQLSASGFEFSISRSAAHRYGQEFEEKIAAIKIATEQARAITDAVGDDAGVTGDALMRLIQEKAFQVLVKMTDLDPESIDFNKLTVAVAKLNNAAVAQKKWQMETQKKAEKALVNIEEKLKSQKLDPEALRVVREEIYGIV